MRHCLSRTAALAVVSSLFLACSAGAPVRPAAPVRGISPPGGTAATVRAAFREAPLPGARVTWRRSPAAETPVAAAVTDGEGNAAFVLGPGRYFLVAEWRGDGDYARPVAPGDRFAYFGGNPVSIGAAGGPAAGALPSAGFTAPLAPGFGPPPARPVREFLLSLEEFDAPRPGPAAEGALAGVAGFVLSGGAPVAGAFVSAYLKPDGGFRDMGFAASAPTAGDGTYVLDLPPGRYYLVARKRAAGGLAGPMRKGDFFGYYAGNPVTVAPGRLSRADIPVTAIRLRNVPFYSGEAAAAAYIEGRIVGRDGKPRAGVYAALYANPELLNRPLFLSDVTGADGRYRLAVPVAGTYFLGARTGYGGSPAPGDLYGRYEGNAAHSVTVRDGDRLTGVDIAVEEVW